MKTWLCLSEQSSILVCLLHALMHYWLYICITVWHSFYFCDENGFNMLFVTCWWLEIDQFQFQIMLLAPHPSLLLCSCSRVGHLSFSNALTGAAFGIITLGACLGTPRKNFFLAKKAVFKKSIIFGEKRWKWIIIKS